MNTKKTDLIFLYFPWLKPQSGIIYMKNWQQKKVTTIYSHRAVKSRDIFEAIFRRQ